MGLKQRSKHGGNDAYYTKPSLALECLKILTDKFNIKEKTIIEPSAGDGSFIKAFETYKLNYLAYDLYPQAKNIIQADFFNVEIKKGSVVVGNPPFGFSASLAVKFFNHAAKNADLIAFIVPASFDKVSIQNSLDHNFILKHSSKCPKNSFLVDGKEYDVPCVFQIWERSTKKRTKIECKINKYFEFTTKENADFAIRRVGGKAGTVLSGLDHNENTTFFCKSTNKDTIKILKEIEPKLKEIAQKTAGVRSISKNEINLTITNK